MSNETPIIKVELRERVGTTYARRLRKNGRLPATIYAKGHDPVSVSVDEKNIITHLRAGSHVMELDTGDGKPATVLVKDLQFGYLGDNLIHVDFTRVNLKQIVTVMMTLEIVGRPKLSEAAGAVLEIPRPEIEIECMVKDIPSTIRVDLATVNEVFTIGDLELPEGVRATLDQERHIAHVTLVKEESEVVEVTEDGEGTDPEVISESSDPETPQGTDSE